MKRFNINNQPLKKDWLNVSDFCNWYVKNGMPVFMPSVNEVFITDDATSVCMFRCGQFQVEHYLIHPKPLVQMHEHPGVEVIKLRLFRNESSATAIASDVLHDGEGHGAGFRLEGDEKGFLLIAVQKWDNTLAPTTVAARWKGKTVGPKQEALIKRLYPDSLVVSGYADVTKTMEYLKELKNVANS
jgi:hypothetical protein